MSKEIKIERSKCCLYCKHSKYIKNSLYGVNCDVHKKSVQITEVCIKFEWKEKYKEDEG